MSEQEADDAATAFEMQIRIQIIRIMLDEYEHMPIETIDQLVALVVRHRTAGHDDGLAQGAANERMG